MNLVQVEVTKCYINLIVDATYSINLKVGKHVSHLSQQKKCIDGVIQFNEKLSILVPRVSLHTNHKISIAIFMQRQQQQKKIIGITNINIQLVSSSTIQIPMKKYKIDQSPDRQATIEALIKVYAQSESPKRTRNEFKGYQNYSPNISPQKQIMDSAVSIPSSFFQTPQVNNCDAQSYEKVIKELEDQIFNLKEKLKQYQNISKYTTALKKIEQNNGFLKEIVSIQEKKNLISNKFISQILNLLEIDTSTIKINQLQNVISKYDTLNINGQQSKGLQTQQIKLISKQRDQLYQLSEQLYNQVQNYKQNQKKLEQVLKKKQEEYTSSQLEIEKLKFELCFLQKKSNKNDDQSSIKKIKQLYQENSILKNQMKEFERKFIQTLKAIQQFKNDALKARSQIIQKDEVIKKLQRLETNQSSDQNLYNLIDLNNAHHTKILEESLKQRAQVFQKLNQLKQNSQVNYLSILTDLKNKIDLSYGTLIKGKITKESILKQKIEINEIIANKILSLNHKKNSNKINGIL